MRHKSIWLLGSIPLDACADVINDFQLIPPKAAAMGEDGDYNSNQHRNTTVRFVTQEHWLTTAMRSFGEDANVQCDWNYAITGNENIQFAEYAPGQHYNWHVDVFPLGFQKFDRKITVITLLSDPTEYKGGDLFVRLYQDYKVPLTKGTMIAFPSILEHMVTKVTTGVRYSATMWINGPCFT